MRRLNTQKLLKLAIIGLEQRLLFSSTQTNEATNASDTLVEVNTMPLSPLQALAAETFVAKQRPDPANMNSILDITSAIVDVKADYDAIGNEGHSSQGKESPATPLANRRQLVKRVDQRFLRLCVLRFDELCELAVAYPEKKLLDKDMESSVLLEACLATLSEAVRFLERRANYPDSHVSTGGNARRAFSPWLGPASCEIIGVWTARHWTPSTLKKQLLDEIRKNLTHCCELFAGDLDVIANMSVRLCSKDAVRNMPNPIEVVGVLNLITLVSKRFPIKVPDLSHLLAPLSFVRTLSTPQALSVLSSLVRIREERDLELVTIITRREVSHLPNYSLTDCIFALRACHVLTGASEPFVAELLSTLVPYANQMSPRQLANVCHLLTMMRNSRRHAQLIRTICAKEIRRLMPALLARTKLLLKQFTVKDARYVMDCFYAYQVQHPFVYTQLTSELSE